MTFWQAVGFLILCLLSSATWLTDEWLPTHLPAMVGEGLRLSLAGVLASLSLFHAGRFRKLPPINRCAAVTAASVGMFGLPFFLLVGAQGKISSTGVVLAFAGIPVLIILAGTASSAGSDLRLLPAAVMGLGGLLILLPLQPPHGSAGVLGTWLLLLAAALTAASIIWLHRLLQSFPLHLAIALAGVSNGLLLLLAAGFSTMATLDHRTVWLDGFVTGVLVDLPQVALLLWLIRVVAPIKVASRYLVAPMLTVVEGLALLHPGLDLRTVFALTLLGSGAYLMLRPERPPPELSLRLE